MIPRHNILPEVAPKIAKVLRESTQCEGRLSTQEGCYCALGAICEAYRREFPDRAKWVTAKLSGAPVFVLSDLINPIATYAPSEVLAWAIGDDRHTVMLDNAPIEERNDDGDFSFDELAELLDPQSPS